MPAKKNALKAGIEASKGEILCFTDADCLPVSRWIEELVKSFKPNVGLVAGYSPYQIPNDEISKEGFFKKLFFKFIAYEEFRAAIWAAGSIGWEIGWLCTGRNLAYRRKVYDEVNGFEKLKCLLAVMMIYFTACEQADGLEDSVCRNTRKFCSDNSTNELLVIYRATETAFLSR